MFKIFRVAVAAALTFCTVAAPAQALAPLPDPAVLSTAPAPAIFETQAAIAPTAAPSADVESSDPLAPPAPSFPDAAVETPAPATSLAQLVLRHSSTAAATSDLECLAVAVYFESKGEPLAGQLAVARVVKNRSKSSRFAKTYCGVIRQAGQFSFVRGSGFPPIARTGANWRTAVAIATVADQDLWEAPARDALYFHARRVAPSARMIRVASVGNHVFYR